MTGVVEKNVVQLQITVDDSSFVKEEESFDDFRCVEDRLRFLEFADLDVYTKGKGCEFFRETILLLFYIYSMFLIVC